MAGAIKLSTAWITKEAFIEGSISAYSLESVHGSAGLSLVCIPPPFALLNCTPLNSRGGGTGPGGCTFEPCITVPLPVTTTPSHNLKALSCIKRLLLITQHIAVRKKRVLYVLRNCLLNSKRACVYSFLSLVAI